LETPHKHRSDCGVVPMEVILTELTSPFLWFFRVELFCDREIWNPFHCTYTPIKSTRV